MQYLYYKKQGVAFNDKQGFNYFRDIGVFKNEIMGKEFGMFNAIAKQNDGNIPHVYGFIIPGSLFLTINSCEYLEAVYVT